MMNAPIDIETHVFALRVLGELESSDERRHRLVQWLPLNKKLDHWKSTRVTAEVISSMVHYLEQEDGLGVREDATVIVGPRTAEMVFESDEYTGARFILGPEPIFAARSSAAPMAPPIRVHPCHPWQSMSARDGRANEICPSSARLNSVITHWRSS